VGRRTGGDLGGQGRAGPEAEGDPGARMPRLEVTAQGAERLGQRGGGEHGDLAARRAVGRPVRGCAGRTGRAARPDRDQQQCEQTPNRAHREGHGSGTSTTTLVALIEAVASTPGSRPSSVAASADISDTTRNGPHCRSTWAITPSLVTLVTSPVNRFRALSATGDPRPGTVASCWVSSASAAPSIIVGPGPSSVFSRPVSIHRRTVSSLTPRRDAA